MRLAVAVTALALAPLTTACTKKSDPPKPLVAETKADAAPSAPVPVPKPKEIEKIATVEGLAPALEEAAACVKNGRLDRRCAGFIKVRKNVGDHAKDTKWADALLAAASTGDATAQVALVLLDEVRAGDDAKFVETLWPLVGKGESTHRTAALRALYGRLGPEHAAQVGEILADAKAPDTLRAAAAYLAVKPAMSPNKKKLAPLLNGMMADTKASPGLRRAAIAAAGKLAHPSAQEAMIALLDDELLGANATVNLAGFTTKKAYDVLWKRLETAANGGKIQVAQVAAVGRLRRHPQFDGAKASELLKKLHDRLAKDAKGGDQQATMMQTMVKRHIDQIRKAKNRAEQANKEGDKAPKKP